MLKNKSVLDKFDLVEKLEDQIAETINGGLQVKNSFGFTKTLFVINPHNSSCQTYQINSGATQTILGDDLFFIWDKDNGPGWDLGIKGGFLSTDNLVLQDLNGQASLDYDLGPGTTTVTTYSVKV